MSEMDSRPNILLVMCDQLSAFATSPYGNDDVLTPHLAALAGRGTTFENAYCNAPLCAPSRASMMTGMLPDAIPVNDNSEELPSTIPTFAHHLRREGYRTVLSGKMHFVGPDQLHGFEERLTTDIYPADLQWVEDWESLGNPPRRDLATHSGRNMSRWVSESGPVRWSTQLDYDEEVHFRALEKIRQLSRKQETEKSQPWFLCVSYSQPHNPYAPAQEYWDRYEGRDLQMPQPAPDGYQETAWDTWVNSYNGFDVEPPSEEAVYRARRSYYAMTSYIDDQLGELQAEVARFGELTNTVVIFISDHGDMIGEHGMFFKRTFREWSTRIPMIFAGGKVGQGQRVARPVSLVDIFPTVLGLAGLAPDSLDMDGSRAGNDIMSPSGAGEEPAPVIIDYNGEGTIAPTRTVVLGNYKYVYVHGEEELLFDLELDPQEWVNLSQKPEFQHLCGELRAICLADWDPAEAQRRIRASQKRRMFINEALSTGLYQPWDFQPEFDASRMYVRRPITQIWDRAYRL